MAAPTGKTRRVSRDSSSSSSSGDEEVLRRCQEAVWESRPAGLKGGGGGDGGDAPQSRRFVVAEHKHDGNELQVSQGFRTHVAKKLETHLNSCISETQIEWTSCAAAGGGEDDDEDNGEALLLLHLQVPLTGSLLSCPAVFFSLRCSSAGFRLFSTSVPGQRGEEPPAAARRRPAPSSSDSDSEMEQRLREAAVSVADLLPAAQEVTEGRTDTVEEKEEKKKKKRKKKREVAEGGAGSLTVGAQKNGEDGRVLDQEEEGAGLKVKLKKKKKKRKETAAED
ncbi:protein CUSTOS isoform X1 [Nelusetta ayraudi]|uniref:protein CUSTOS isoform X1 n=1 Tax=Nelusetta ayraudi TaxID=303726 RepID=UPI003F6F6BC8